jgi:signal transduction histidine kinase
MSLKTKLVLAITSLVFLVTAILSLVYVSQLLLAAVQQSYDTNLLVAQQIRYALQLALESGLKDQQVDPNNQAALRTLAAVAVRDNPTLTTVIKSVNRYSPTVFDITIGDNQGRALLTTGQVGQDQPLPVRPSYQQLRSTNALELARAVFGKAQVYDVVVPLERNGEFFASVHIGVRTTFLKELYRPWLNAALTLMGLALATALLVAFLLGNLALRPMEELNMQLDYWTPALESITADEKDTDTVVRVSNKIERIGQRMRNVEEVFSALKENLDQVLGNLQDGIMLFTGDGRAVLVSSAVERFLHIDRNLLLGQHARDIFDRGTVLGKTVRDAWDARVTLVQEEIVTESGNRIEVSLDFIHDERENHTSEGLGALLTLHDQESVEVIESELELSRRMAAIGRLTSGVGHEVKNPINAIVVHLELLKTKLGNAGAPGSNHLEIIDSEIHRLDRVVQTLVDFSRPVEVKLVEYDLRHVITDVVRLSGAEMSMRDVTLTSILPSYPVVAKVDVDLLKQAVLNVVQNGAHSMANGGKLTVKLIDEGKTAVIQVQDEGSGISEELREKIFDLYFTTKKDGSGIGLAMTYRILQLHHGSIDVQSEIGRGSVFELRIPLSAMDRGRRHPQPALGVEAKGFEG